MEGRACAGIIRLNPDGLPDPGFNAVLPYASGEPVRSIALQADGKILLGGDFSSVNGQPVSRIARLNPDGSLDLSFNPGADATVTALTLQPDGKILAGGGFTTIGGKLRNGFARLLNTGPATQTLTFDGSTIRWLRGGTAPAVWATYFEQSKDGTNWTALGQGTHVTGGWPLTNVAAPAGTKLRARGFVAGGFANSSSWIVESTTTVGMQILSGTLQKAPFGFTLSGPIGQTVIVEGSTDLQTWIPLKTNLVPGNGLLTFTDPDSAVYQRRFYRARVRILAEDLVVFVLAIIKGGDDWQWAVDEHHFSRLYTFRGRVKTITRRLKARKILFPGLHHLTSSHFHTGQPHSISLFLQLPETLQCANCLAALNVDGSDPIGDSSHLQLINMPGHTPWRSPGPTDFSSFIPASIPIQLLSSGFGSNYPPAATADVSSE